MWEMKNFSTISPYDSKPVGFKCKNFLLFSPLHSLTLEMEVSIKRGHRAGAAWDLFAAFLCVLSLPLWLHVPLPLVQEESWPSLISPVSCAQINTRSVASRTVFTSSGFQVVFGKNLVFSWSRFFFQRELQWVLWDLEAHWSSFAEMCCQYMLQCLTISKTQGGSE